MHRKRFSKKVVALSALAVLGLAACGGGGDGTSAGDADEDPGNGSASVSLVAKEFEFTPSDITVDAPSFSLELRNEGAIEHDFSVEDTDVKIFAKAAETATGEIEMEPGTYTFFCSIPGHREGGMEGTLTVKG